MDRELWRAIMLWLEIDRQTQEKLAEVRSELALNGKLEKPQQDLLSIKLY